MIIKHSQVDVTGALAGEDNLIIGKMLSFAKTEESVNSATGTPKLEMVSNLSGDRWVWRFLCLVDMIIKESNEQCKKVPPLNLEK